MRFRWQQIAYGWAIVHLAGLAIVAITGWVPARPSEAGLSLLLASMIAIGVAVSDVLSD